MTQKKSRISKVSANLFISILVISLFSIDVIGQEESTIVFNPDDAGITPDKWYYFLDWEHTPEEYWHEFGMVLQNGNIEVAQTALKNLKESINEEASTLETTSLDGITLEALQSIESENVMHKGIQTIEETQINVLDYENYADAIEKLLNEKIESGDISKNEVEVIIDNVNAPVNELGAILEEKTHELVHEVAHNSDVSPSEAEIVYEDSFRAEYGNRFEEIASIDNVLDLETKIAELRVEAEALREKGDAEGAAAVDNLLTLAESHGEDCLNSEEGNFETQGLNHLNSAENLVDNVEKYLEGDYDNLEDMPVWPPYTTEDIQNQISIDEEDAAKFIEDYETLKGKYADDTERLAWIEQEKERSEKVEELSEKLSEETINKWSEELEKEGLSEPEIIAEVHERVVEEQEAVNGRYLPPGLYILPGNEEAIDKKAETESELELEVIEIGRVERVKEIDPETGEIITTYKGWHDGSLVENVQEGGGYALNVPYLDPDKGIYYTFNSGGYSYTTLAGVTHVINYLPEHTIENTYEYGDEAYSYITEDGNKVTYSTTGYEFRDQETDKVITSEPYTKEKTDFSDGSYTDLEATGYVFNNKEGEARVYAYIPEFKTYQDISSGKIVVPHIAPHIESTTYDPASETYKSFYAGQPWSYSGQGVWTNPVGLPVKMPVVPAPVGYEGEGKYLTPNGEEWIYSATNGLWTESTSGKTYTPAPNNHYRYNERTGYMTDNRGETLAQLGTTITINGETFTVTADKGWTNSQGQAVPPPYDSSTGKQYPSSATYHSEENSGLPGGNTNGVWSFNTATNHWVSSETGDKYDPATGNIVHPDGTVFGPENRPAGQGSEGIPSCYGCYYSGEGSTGTSHYGYDYGSYYQARPDGSYGYVGSSGQYSGATSTTDAQGNTWTRSTDGTWTSSTGESYSSYGYDPAAAAAGWPGGAYPGGVAPYSGPYTCGGGYDSSGNYVGGEYGGYDSSGAYTGGATYSQNPDGTWTDSGSSGTYSDGTSSGSYSDGTSGGTTSGGDSGGTTSGGDSGGSAPSGGGSTGGAITEIEGSKNNFFSSIIDWLRKQIDG